MLPELDALLGRLDTVKVDDLPRLLGDLRHIEAAAMARLNAAVAAGQSAHQPDRLLHIEDAAERLGMSKDWLYDHKDSSPVHEACGYAGAI